MTFQTPCLCNLQPGLLGKVSNLSFPSNLHHIISAKRKIERITSFSGNCLGFPNRLLVLCNGTVLAYFLKDKAVLLLIIIVNLQII